MWILALDPAIQPSCGIRIRGWRPAEAFRGLQCCIDHEAADCVGRNRLCAAVSSGARASGTATRRSTQRTARGITSCAPTGRSWNTRHGSRCAPRAASNGGTAGDERDGAGEQRVDRDDPPAVIAHADQRDGRQRARGPARAASSPGPSDHQRSIAHPRSQPPPASPARPGEPGRGGGGRIRSTAAEAAAWPSSSQPRLVRPASGGAAVKHTVAGEQLDETGGWWKNRLDHHRPDHQQPARPPRWRRWPPALSCSDMASRHNTPPMQHAPDHTETPRSAPPARRGDIETSRRARAGQPGPDVERRNGPPASRNTTTIITPQPCSRAVGGQRIEHGEARAGRHRARHAPITVMTIEAAFEAAVLAERDPRRGIPENRGAIATSHRHGGPHRETRRPIAIPVGGGPCRTPATATRPTTRRRGAMPNRM